MGTRGGEFWRGCLGERGAWRWKLRNEVSIGVCVLDGIRSELYMSTLVYLSQFHQRQLKLGVPYPCFATSSC